MKNNILLLLFFIAGSIFIEVTSKNKKEDSSGTKSESKEDKKSKKKEKKQSELTEEGRKEKRISKPQTYIHDSSKKELTSEEITRREKVAKQISRSDDEDNFLSHGFGLDEKDTKKTKIKSDEKKANITKKKEKKEKAEEKKETQKKEDKEKNSFWGKLKSGTSSLFKKAVGSDIGKQITGIVKENASQLAQKGIEVGITKINDRINNTSQKIAEKITPPEPQKNTEEDNNNNNNDNGKTTEGENTETIAESKTAAEEIEEEPNFDEVEKIESPVQEMKIENHTMPVASLQEPDYIPTPAHQVTPAPQHNHTTTIVPHSLANMKPVHRPVKRSPAPRRQIIQNRRR